MMPAANQGVGMNMGFPDVCTTPAAPAPIPIPYPNIGMNAMAMPFVPNVLVSMAPAQNMGAKPTLTNGDNAGVAHPLFMQPGGTLVGNPKILIGGMPANHLLTPSYGNNFNNPVGAKTVPSVTNVLLASTATQWPASDTTVARQLQHEHGRFRRLPAGVLHVQLPCIALRTHQWLAQLLRQPEHRTIESLLLDLRGNPGGSLAAVHSIGIQIMRSGLRVAVATDGQTASAAEILAAWLHDHADARLFGERTFGKGRATRFAVTSRHAHACGPTVQITRANGDAIDGVGVGPDEACHAIDACPRAIHWLQRQAGTTS